MHNWEMLLHFHVHGSGKNLYGDGFAFWYTKEKNNEGGWAKASLSCVA